MMINGYKIGTQVKWGQSNSLETGVIEQVYREPTEIMINNELKHIEVKADSPSYLIRQSNGKHVILSHNDVILKQTNSHT